MNVFLFLADVGFGSICCHERWGARQVEGGAYRLEQYPLAKGRVLHKPEVTPGRA